MANSWGKLKTVTEFIFLGSKITVDSDCSHEIKRCLFLGRKPMTNLDSVLKSRDITLPTKVYIVQAMIFFSSHVWMWELDCKNGWVLKNWCFWTVMLEKTLESPLDSKELKPVDPKGNQLWIFIGRTDTEAETPVLCHLMRRANSLEKTLMLGKIEGRRRRDDRGWDGWMASPTRWTWVWASSQSWRWTGRPGCCSPWGRKESDTTERLNWTTVSKWLHGLHN